MFGRKKPPAPDLLEAREAQSRALESIEHLAGQDQEVTELVERLEHRRLRNNFGDSLVIAMGKRQS